MPDVVAILGVPFGNATFTVAPTGGDTVTIPGSRRWLYGPSPFGNTKQNGQFELQVPSTDAGQTANTYRYIGDVQASSGVALTSYTYAGNAFLSLGGI